MGSRRRAREHALQILYQVDVGEVDLEAAIELFWDEVDGDDEGILFASRIARGVSQNLAQIDEIIERFSINWKLHRMPGVDRNILRIAVYELLHCPDIPVMVSINEAIELGKRFSTGESGAFINGILDKISKNVEVDKDLQAS
jgi:N utilization substance protein B